MADEIKSILDTIATLSDLEQLRELRRAVEARAKEICDARAQKAVTDRWAKLERCKPGAVLYVCSRGIHIGGPLQRGDSVKVVEVNRDRERLYVRLHRVRGKLVRGADQYALTPAQCNSYMLDRDKPEDPVDERQRRMGADLAKMLEET